MSSVLLNIRYTLYVVLSILLLYPFSVYHFCSLIATLGWSLLTVLHSQSPESQTSPPRRPALHPPRIRAVPTHPFLGRIASPVVNSTIRSKSMSSDNHHALLANTLWCHEHLGGWSNRKLWEHAEVVVHCDRANRSDWGVGRNKRCSLASRLRDGPV